MKYKLNDNVMHYIDENKNSKYLINLDENDVYVLDDVSSIIINLFEENLTDEEVVDYIYENLEHDLNYDVIKNDIASFIEILLLNNFISAYEE